MYETTKLSTLEKIEYSKTLYQHQKAKVQQEQDIEYLLLNDYVDMVKNNCSRYDFLDSIFDKAQKEVDKKYKKERQNIEALIGFISEDFFNNKKVKIKNIIAGGFENYYWRVEVELEGKGFAICIPVMKNISVSNFKYANDGKFTLMLKERDSVFSVLISSYEIKDIAKFMENYLAEKGN